MQSGRAEPETENFWRAIPRPLRLFLALALALNSLAVLCEAFCKYVRHYSWPYATPFLPGKPLPDFTICTEAFDRIHTPAFFHAPGVPYLYPAAVAPLYGFFLSLPHRRMVYAATLVGVLVLAAAGFYWRMRKAGLCRTASALIAVVTFCGSYPAAFEVKQGNVELFIWVFVAAGIWFFQRDHLHAAAGLFGVAIAMKIFPFVYLGLFLARRKFWPVLTSAATAAGLTLVSLRYLTPSIRDSWQGVSQAMTSFSNAMALFPVYETHFDHSLYGLVKLLAGFRGHPPSTAVATRSLTVYLACVAITGIALFFLRIVHQPFINQVMALCVASIWLTPVSFDYTLLHLYIPFALLVFLLLREPPGKLHGVSLAMPCLAILTTIQTEFIWGGHSYGGQVKAVVLGLLFFVALRYPFPSQGERPRSPLRS